MKPVPEARPPGTNADDEANLPVNMTDTRHLICITLTCSTRSVCFCAQYAKTLFLFKQLSCRYFNSRSCMITESSTYLIMSPP